MVTGIGCLDWRAVGFGVYPDAFKLPAAQLSGKTHTVMDKKLCYCLSLVTAMLLGVIAGCSKSDLEAKSPAASQPSPEVVRTVVRLHWLGKKRLGAESNATNFMAIWNLPESAKLEAQTLDRLATAPWRLFASTASLSNAPTARLRPLLDDLVQEESYLEVQAVTNQPVALALALRLDAARAALWQTNLPIILKSVFASARVLSAEASDFRLQTSDLSFSLSRSGDWTLLSFSRASNAAPSILASFRDRIAATQTPCPPRTTNFWLEADLDLRAFGLPASALGLQPSLSTRENLPELKLTLIGDGQNVRTRGELSFPSPLSIPLPAWNLPTNLVREPLISFAAVRGLRGLLAARAVPSWLGLAEWPDQYYSWGRSGPPLQIYAAFPTPNSANDFSQIAHPIADWIRAHLPTKDYGAVTFATNSALLNWDGLHFGLPSLRVVTNVNTDFILLSLAAFQLARTNQLPTPLIERITGESNLVTLAWEFTGERLSQWRYFDDASRMTFDAARRPRVNPYMASIEWIAMVMTNLQHSITEVQLAGPNRLALTRKSTVGLTGWEINVLANWLELPQFPAGFQTLFATNPAPPIVRRKVSPNPPPSPPP